MALRKIALWGYRSNAEDMAHVLIARGGKLETICQ